MKTKKRKRTKWDRQIDQELLRKGTRVTPDFDSTKALLVQSKPLPLDMIFTQMAAVLARRKLGQIDNAKACGAILHYAMHGLRIVNAGNVKSH